MSSVTNDTKCPECGVPVGQPHHHDCSQSLNLEPCDVPVAAVDTTHPAGQETAMKSYRVTLRANVIVEVDVKAENRFKAKGKAFFWHIPEANGFSRIGRYHWIDEDCDEEAKEDNDDGELFWEIVQESGYHDILNVEEIDNAKGESDVLNK